MLRALMTSGLLCSELTRLQWNGLAMIFYTQQPIVAERGDVGGVQLWSQLTPA